MAIARDAYTTTVQQNAFGSTTLSYNVTFPSSSLTTGVADSDTGAVAANEITVNLAFA